MKGLSERKTGFKLTLGHLIEPVVTELFYNAYLVDHPEDKIILWNPYMIYQHKIMDHHLSTPDRLFWSEKDGLGVVELKSSEDYDGWAEQCPDYYYLQVQHQLYVTGLNFAYIAVILGLNSFKYFRIDRDEDCIRNMLTMCDRFYFDFFIKDILPPIDGSEASAEYLKKAWPEAKADSYLNLEDPFINAAELYLACKAREKEAKAEADYYSNLLKDQLKDNEKGFLSNGTTVTWSTVSRKGFWSPDCTYRKFDVKPLKIKKVGAK
jgi:predicted phage-related endonuclease